MCPPTDLQTNRHHESLISCRPCTVVVGQRDLAVSFIKHDSRDVCLAPGCCQLSTSVELLHGSARWRPRLLSARCLTALIRMFSPLETNQRKCGVNSPQSAAPTQAGVETTTPHGNDSAPQ